MKNIILTPDYYRVGAINDLRYLLIRPLTPNVATGDNVPIEDKTSALGGKKAVFKISELWDGEIIYGKANYDDQERIWQIRINGKFAKLPELIKGMGFIDEAKLKLWILNNISLAWESREITILGIKNAMGVKVKFCKIDRTSSIIDSKPNQLNIF